MAFNLTYEDGTTEELEFSDIDVPLCNTKRPTKIMFGPYGVSKYGEFYFGDLVVPFAFFDESSELIFFSRVHCTTDMDYGTVTTKAVVIAFGMRSTVETHNGPRNHVQLIWVYPDGTVKIGGNK